MWLRALPRPAWGNSVCIASTSVGYGRAPVMRVTGGHGVGYIERVGDVPYRGWHGGNDACLCSTFVGCGRVSVARVT